jgi:hypothetical protein
MINLLGFPIVEEIAVICPYDDNMGRADEYMSPMF